MREEHSKYLEEPLQPPNLEDAFRQQNEQLEYAPPLDPCIGAFCGISVRPLTDHDVGLLILDLSK